MGNKKHTVRVAWNRETVYYVEEHGWEAMILENERLEATGKYSDFNYNVVGFDTEAELNAYCKGINDANGWDAPMLLLPEKTEEHSWMYRDGTNYKTFFFWNDVFLDLPEPEIDIDDDFDMGTYSITDVELCKRLKITYNQIYDHPFVTKIKK